MKLLSCILISFYLLFIYNQNLSINNIKIIMIPNQYSVLPLVKLEELDSTQQKTLIFPYNFPYFTPMGLISNHQLYLTVKSQIQDYERTNGIKNESKCNCQHKNKKLKKNTQELKKSAIKNSNQDLNIQREKMQNFQQKQGRNVNSNLLRMFFRRLQYKIQNQPQSIQNILRKLEQQLTVEGFQKWVSENKVDYRNYIRVPQVKRLFFKEETNMGYSLALRVIFKNFLDDESVCCYLTSRKIKKDTMKLNLSVIRTIIHELFGVTV